MRLQEFYGVPLEGDVGREAYQLVCADSQGERSLNNLNEHGCYLRSVFRIHKF